MFSMLLALTLMAVFFCSLASLDYYFSAPTKKKKHRIYYQLKEIAQGTFKPTKLYDGICENVGIWESDVTGLMHKKFFTTMAVWPDGTGNGTFPIVWRCSANKWVGHELRQRQQLAKYLIKHWDRIEVPQ